MSTSSKGTNPMEELQSDIRSMQSDLDTLRSGINLTSVRDALEDLDTKLTLLPQRIADLRTKNYPFEKTLETKTADLQKRWPQVRASVQAQAGVLGLQLRNSIQPLEHRMAQLVSTHVVQMARPMADALESEISSLQSRVKSAESTLEGMYNTLSSEMEALFKHIDEIEWMIAQIAEAKFTLLPTEAGVKAVKAVWARDGKEDKNDPEGVLYLTDQRILFEQKQEVATKKVLFVTTEREKVQSLQFEAPLSQIKTVTANKQGLFKNEDFIKIEFESGAFSREVLMHIWQDSAEWTGAINRVRTGDLDKDRTVEVDQTAVEKVKAAPTKCPNCGGILKKDVLRGQDSISCEYCGAVIRL